jgi:2-polyprenyl-3-methyl-5-hydroxy-6-metoxy-1,4-benzoquinol methylase
MARKIFERGRLLLKSSRHRYGAWLSRLKHHGLAAREQPAPQVDDFEVKDSGQRYGAWLGKQKKYGLLRREYLIPQLKVETPNTLPPMMASRPDMGSAEKRQLRKEVKALAPWGYSIHLTDGVLTSIPAALDRTVFRAHLIGNAIRHFSGGDLAGQTVFDMACNHGYFGLQCAFDGARSVFGSDLRELNIKKAELLKRHFRIDNVTLAVENVYAGVGQYDIVLNLGLLYHVTDPYKLMQMTYDLCGRFAVVDTITHLDQVSAFIQITNKDKDGFAEGEFSVEYHPTYRALLDLMHAVGFKGLVEVVPVEAEGRATNPLYDKLERRCIIGFK